MYKAFITRLVNGECTVSDIIYSGISLDKLREIQEKFPYYIDTNGNMGRHQNLQDAIKRLAYLQGEKA